MYKASTALGFKFFNAIFYSILLMLYSIFLSSGQIVVNVCNTWVRKMFRVRQAVSLQKSFDIGLPYSPMKAVPTKTLYNQTPLLPSVEVLP